MNKQTYTEAPWLFEIRPYHQNIVFGPDGKQVAMIVGDSAEAEYNGFLIAQAPRMLDFIKKFKEFESDARWITNATEEQRSEYKDKLYRLADSIHYDALGKPYWT